MTGLKSSFPDAKIVVLIASKRTFEEIVEFDGSVIGRVLGNSSPLAYASAYFP